MTWRYADAAVIRRTVATALGATPTRVKGLDWFVYPNRLLAEKSAHLAGRLTGDYCSVVQSAEGYRILRRDPSGKSVQPGDDL